MTVVLAFVVGSLVGVLGCRYVLRKRACSSVSVHIDDLLELSSSETKDYFGEISKKNPLLELFVNSLPLSMWAIDRDLKLRHSLSPVVSGKTGTPAHELFGLDLYTVFQTRDREHPSISAHLRALEGETVSFETEWGGRVFAGYTHPWRNQKGEVKGCIGVALDNTAGKLHLERLLAITQELERSNEDLRRFSYAVSHDLKEPVRMISMYMQLLLREPRLTQDETFEKYGPVVAENAARMQSLVDSLLRFSRIPAATLDYSEFEPEELLSRIQHDFRTFLTNKKAQIVFAPLPKLNADRTLVDQLLRNLISNALKFNECATPTVEVTAERRGDFVQFCVHDNGIGIPAEDVPKLFKPFARLHPRDTYEGDGIGLSLCQKIVARHGGSISLESKEGEGTSVLFTLPGGHDKPTLARGANI